jgi:beta-glucosidase
LAADGKDAANLALNAGVDMEMVSRLYNQNGAALLKEGKFTQQTIDEAVRRILRIKFRLGLFDKPYADEARESRVVFSTENQRAAREIAARSMVLLKNDRNTLPISKNVSSIALIGPLADSQKDMIGAWSGDGKASDAVTLLQGIRSKAGPQVKINYAKGCDVMGDNTSGFDEAVNAAKTSDVVIIAIGEAAEMSGEASSRSTLDLPGRQVDLVKAVQATGKPIIIVLMNGRPLTISWLAENSPAILETWFAGTQSGNAIADVLFGDVNPGGKLPVTFPRSLGQVPIYYNHMNTGRPPDPNSKWNSKYIDIDWTPLFPFGYGLSYTQFALSNLQLSARNIQPDGKLTVTVDVQNTGSRAGDEVVQLYIRDMAASRTRPVKELKGFQRVSLQAGEKRQLTFTLTPAELASYNQDMRFVVEPGVFNVMVGNSSADPKELKTSFEVVAK